MAGFMAAAPPLLRYVSRALVDGSPAVIELFDELVSGVEEFLTAGWPDRFPPEAQRTRDAGATMGARCRAARWRCIPWWHSASA